VKGDTNRINPLDSNQRKREEKMRGYYTTNKPERGVCEEKQNTPNPNPYLSTTCRLEKYA